MLLCQLQPIFTTREATEENIDWEEAARQLPQPLLLSCLNWIKQMKAQTDGSIARRQCTPVDTNCFNEQQMNAYDTVSTHYTENNQQPLHMLILGTAGTGKLFLIQALSQVLEDKSLTLQPLEWLLLTLVVLHFILLCTNQYKNIIVMT
jgi:DNA replication protein DnaC